MKKRQANVYDAVSDKIFDPHRYTKPLNSSEYPRLKKQRPRGPDEHLKIVSADPEVQLPNSDLLRSLYQYISVYCTKHQFSQLFESLDETALLAFGFLIEKTMETLLGEGENMFIEKKQDI
ncbi:hypothetical protein T552_00595 [Pneumocystis carinii B80]|uniref:Uncharacterized protein n=1 Tax=Pneumocystis carinii (strain B80) TaxID=1408658 RepID=A0A0W4ZP17_PNEC8|nr:hypothetical protein T552_00595 [Pneumocystis carinii B80]KTW30117.1 hypothetical protein T552_00595 [Pneumocystis carinii B80]